MVLSFLPALLNPRTFSFLQSLLLWVFSSMNMTQDAYRETSISVLLSLGMEA